LNLAMKAEEGKRQDDQKTEETMMRDIKAEKQHQVRTALTMKDDVRQTRALINKAIKEQNAERAHGEAEMRLDNAALAKAKVATSNAGKSTRGNTLFDQALKEAQADRAKGRAERDQDLKAAVVGKRAESGHGPSQTLSKGSDSLIQQAIREQDDAMQKGIKEEETDNRAAEAGQSGLSVEGRGKQESLIKLARQAMGEIDQDEAAKRAKERADEKAEIIVHKEHVQAREKSEVENEFVAKTEVRPQLKSRDSMLMLVKRAESEVSKDKTLSK